MNMGFLCPCWVWYMGFVGIHSIMLVLYVYTSCWYTMLCFVLCCAYHVYDKMSFRCFCVLFWTPLSTKIVGIIMFLCFWNIKWLCIFTYYPYMFSCPSLHTFAYDAHTHTHPLTCWVNNAIDSIMLWCLASYHVNLLLNYSLNSSF